MKRTINLSGTGGSYGYKKEGLRFSNIELKHLLIAWAALSFAFANILGGLSVISFAVAGITVGIGFVFHEMAHKFTAQYYGYFAEFRANFQALGLAIIMSFFGFIIAAPGAVMISGHSGSIERNKYGIISLAGPLINLVLAAFFFVIAPFFPILIYGAMINAWLGLFNMIPFGNFDGRKILAWNKVVYGLTTGFALLLVFGMSVRI